MQVDQIWAHEKDDPSAGEDQHGYFVKRIEKGNVNIGKMFEVIVGQQSGPPTQEKLTIITTLPLLSPHPAPSTEHFHFFLHIYAWVT